MGFTGLQNTEAKPASVSALIRGAGGMQKNRARSLRCNRISYWGRNRESAAKTLRTLLGSSVPFLTRGGSIPGLGAPFAKEKRRKEGLDPTFRLERAKIKYYGKSKKIPKPGFFFFSKMCSRGTETDSGRGVCRVLHPFPRGTLGKVFETGWTRPGKVRETGVELMSFTDSKNPFLF